MVERLDKNLLLQQMTQWDAFLRRKVHLIACGGTAMTLLDVKESTRDVDFIVPVHTEYNYVIRTLQELGYENTRGWGWAKKGEAFIFDLFPGKRIHTTDLLDDPLETGHHKLIKEFTYIYLGVLNDYDLIVSKLFRGTSVDFQDTVQLARAHKKELDLRKLEAHFFELLSYHPVGEDRVRGHWDSFVRKLSEAGDE
ncbi:MAG: hypothetical protein K8I82_04535 [Anaerolineae bacterium]|nr:hypothetical protein [Anaerolineae bacterium]